MGRGLQFVTEKTQPGAVAGVGEGDLTSRGLWSLKYIMIWTADLRLSEPVQANLIPSLHNLKEDHWWTRLNAETNTFIFLILFQRVDTFFFSCTEKDRKCEAVLD